MHFLLTFVYKFILFHFLDIFLNHSVHRVGLILLLIRIFSLLYKCVLLKIKFDLFK
jgi:hypothetical protein